MNLLNEIAALLRKEILLEYRQKYAISGIFLYVLSTVYIVYAASVRVEKEVWYSLFWIIILFASVNAIAKSFMQENSTRQLYYYTLANPIAVILSKIIYNFFLLFFLSLLCFAAFSIVAGNPVKDYFQFISAIILGSIGFGITFTFISTISSKASNGATLMAILSFPLIIPILMTLIKLSAQSLRLIQDTSYTTDIVLLIAIDLILLALSLVLFPYLWRD